MLSFLSSIHIHLTIHFPHRLLMDIIWGKNLSNINFSLMTTKNVYYFHGIIVYYCSSRSFCPYLRPTIKVENPQSCKWISNLIQTTIKLHFFSITIYIQTIIPVLCYDIEGNSCQKESSYQVLNSKKFPFKFRRLQYFTKTYRLRML